MNSSFRKASAIAVAITALALTGCGAVSTLPEGAGIEEIRRRAAERPNDPDAQALWAEAELFMSGGDAARTEIAISSAMALAPENPRISFLHAMERQHHGELDAALDAHLQTITLAARSRDELAPALAEVSIALVVELDDSVTRYRERVSEVFAPLHAEPGNIGPQARHAIGLLLTDLAYRRGDIQAVRALQSAQGCPSVWRVAGPFGPRQLLGFDREFAPETAGPLDESYDLGPGRGTRATRELEPRGCMLHLGNGPTPGPGATYAETDISVPRAGEYVLRLESPNSVEVFVDDRSIARIDRRVAPVGRTSFHPIHLDEGSHRVMVKTVTRHPNPILLLSLVRQDDLAGNTWSDVEPGIGRPLEIALRASRAIARADYVHARETLTPFLHDPEATSAMLMLGSVVALSDPLMGQQVAADEARRLLMLAAERDERAWFPRLQLANLEPDETTRVRLLRSSLERWPHLVILPLTLIDVLEARGWDAQVDAAIEIAQRMVPDACRPKRAALNSVLRRGRANEVGALADELVRCDARSDARMLHAVRQRRFEDAHAEITRIAALEPRSSRFQTADAELTLARNRGDDASIERLLTELSELAPTSDSVVLMRIDRLFSEGHAQEARSFLETALQTEPGSMGGLRRVLHAAFGVRPIESFRQDGARVIREFEASGRQYDAPKVLVLDYTVVHVFEDGSSLELTHNIIRVQSEEAVDDEGEFSLPGDAQLLTLHTIKSDGRRLEPDEIEGKDTLSLPNLAVGDYVEFEYLRAEPAPAGFPHGALGDRFYFQSFEVPFDRSELTVSLPESVRPIIERRGPAPELEESVENGRRVLRFRVRESRPRVMEPSSVSSREFLPSVFWGYNAPWESYVESLRDVLADREIRDPAHARLVREIIGNDGHASVEQRARRIYQWVIANIDDANDPFGQAATMVHGRTGNRARVLLYLLHLAGVEAELALARSFATDPTPSELADDQTYAFLLVRMQGSDGPIWLWPGARGTPFGFLPVEPVIRGQTALILNERAELATVSDPGIDTDLATVVADIHVDPEGGAHIEVNETFRGASAVAWRHQLEGIPAAHLEDVFERQYVARIAAGARMSVLRITGRENAEEPLVLHYEFDVSRLGRMAENAHLVPQLYSIGLSTSYAALARRTTTQILSGGARDVILRVHLPEGANTPNLPEARELRGPHGATADWRASKTDNVVTLERSVRLPRARIEPEEYPEFARFARTYDEAERFELRVEPR